MPNKVTVGALCFDGPRRKVIVDLSFASLPRLEILPKEARTIEKVIAHLRRNRRAYTTACFMLAALLEPTGVFAAAGMSGGKNIILLLQKASFWVGMGITIWGIVEAQLDFPGWKGRILKGILGYIGILLVPLIFMELQSSLQVDVWENIEHNQQDLDNQLHHEPSIVPPSTDTTMTPEEIAQLKRILHSTPVNGVK